jgi:CheY-like chemotaxis protein
VESEGAGKGAMLTVRLPVRRSVASALTPLQTARAGTLAEATVLVVEDDADTLDLLEATLKSVGAKPVGARSVGDALRAVDGVTFDALVSDIAMPGQDGYTLMTLLRDRLGPAMPDVSVALTAFASAADRQKAINAGFTEHLSKPVNPDVLLQTLDELIAATSARRATSH